MRGGGFELGGRGREGLRGEGGPRGRVVVYGMSPEEEKEGFSPSRSPSGFRLHTRLTHIALTCRLGSRRSLAPHLGGSSALHAACTCRLAHTRMHGADTSSPFPLPASPLPASPNHNHMHTRCCIAYTVFVRCFPCASYHTLDIYLS